MELIFPPDPSKRYTNRELSVLDFNERVLEVAETDLPLLERVRFLAIFSHNLDEFFGVRVAALHGRVKAGLIGASPDGMPSRDQIKAIHARMGSLLERQAEIFSDLREALNKEGISFCSWAGLDGAEREALSKMFDERVRPVLTPLAVDPAHPFPYISTLSLNLAVMVRNPDDGHTKFARIKLPQLLPRFVVTSDGTQVVALEDIIAAHLDRLFPGMHILEAHPFRVTRDADFDVGDEATDLILAVEEALLRRTKFGDAVRLEVQTDFPQKMLEVLMQELKLSGESVYKVEGPIDLSGLFSLTAMDRPDLKLPPLQPAAPPEFAQADTSDEFFAAIREQDIMVHHPYESFAQSVERFIFHAAHDPDVLAIKQTLYRTAGDDSEIVKALIAAAEAGKQVVALIELKARFDEQANIERARRLEEAGVHVVYGLVGLKTHAKTLMVVRQESDQLRIYCHIATGNYNPHTALMYEDIGIFTCDPEIGADLTALFNHLTGYTRNDSYKKLLVAPTGLRPSIAALIKDQSHPGGRIRIKLNSLVDPETIDNLYRASEAGCKIDLVVRGACSMRPQVPGLSENVTIRSIVGRFLEHSRIFQFGTGESAKYLVGSADLMQRNLDRRVEVLIPIEDSASKGRLDRIMDLALADNEGGWILGPESEWKKRTGIPQVSLQEALVDSARALET